MDQEDSGFEKAPVILQPMIEGGGGVMTPIDCVQVFHLSLYYLLEGCHGIVVACSSCKKL